MLALKFTERKHDIHFPCYVQPKLNGVRCIYQGGKFISRKGKEYTTLNHLVKELEAIGIPIPDGEIYIHGATFQEIVRMVKKDRGTEELQYCSTKLYIKEVQKTWEQMSKVLRLTE
jgi:hypothetical protein